MAYIIAIACVLHMKVACHVWGTPAWLYTILKCIHTDYTSGVSQKYPLRVLIQHHGVPKLTHPRVSNINIPTSIPKGATQAPFFLTVQEVQRRVQLY